MVIDELNLKCDTKLMELYMNTFGLDKNYEQFNFEEISVEELQVISGGSGGGTNWNLVGTSLALAGIALAAVSAPISMPVLAFVAAAGAMGTGVAAGVQAAG
jgi:bacteriocin-like protein